MQIDVEKRSVTMSVSEFASFKPYATPGFGGVSAVWRAQVGTLWHQRIQADSETAGTGMKNELPIEGTLMWRGWELQLSGRIDQFRQDPDKTHIREIKTVNEPLPISREKLLEHYPSYPLQLLAYRELILNQLPAQQSEQSQRVEALNPIPKHHLELLFVEIGSGLTQSIILDSSYDASLAEQFDLLVDYLESRKERLANLRSLAFQPAYEAPRPGQETVQQDLSHAFAKSRICFLEAPTGYGKTGVAWEQAARCLASGQADRILYLTSKSTGQTEAVERLRSILSQSSSRERSQPSLPKGSSSSTSIPLSSHSATFWQIRNKQEHCIHAEFRCSPLSCPYLADLHSKWHRSGLQRLYLLSKDELDLESIKAEGRSTGICPYEIMRAGLGYRDIWIGDYNYLFSPGSARLLEEQNDFEPSRTFLIIDEAHNLPSRVASAFTFDMDIQQIHAAEDDLRANRASSRIQNLMRHLADLPSSLSPNSEAPSFIEEEFYDLLSSAVDLLSREPLSYDELQPETNEFLFALVAAQSSRKRGELQHILWSPDRGRLRLECIDASRLIAQQFSQYSHTLFLSATLSPLDTFLEETGLTAKEKGHTKNEKGSPPQLHSSIPHLKPPTPWREGAYDVAIDLRVDTRLRSRQQHMKTTASTIAASIQKHAPVIVYFPSYAYAQSVLDSLHLEHPFLRAEIQPRSGGSLAERTTFLESALAFNDALFLILGSSYSEGVDTLGGKVKLAVVVSPSLPEMNLIQEAKRKRADLIGRNGFEGAYLHPGIQKVNQALGRLVRAPGQKVKACLHCERFAEPKTSKYLDPLYRAKRYIHSDSDLQTWLNS